MRMLSILCSEMIMFFVNIQKIVLRYSGYISSESTRQSVSVLTVLLL